MRKRPKWMKTPGGYRLHHVLRFRREAMEAIWRKYPNHLGPVGYRWPLPF